MRKITLLFILLFFLVGCIASPENKNNKSSGNNTGCDITSVSSECGDDQSDRPDGWKVKDLLEENATVISFGESLPLLDETNILFFSFDDCPWCYDAIPVLEEVLSENNLRFYYVDVNREEREEGNSVYDQVYNRLKDYCGEKLYVPFCVFIKNGEVVACNTGTVDGHDKVDGILPTITEEQKSQLKGIYTDCINEYLK